MIFLATAAATAMAAVLLWAGLEKARNPAPTAATIRALGAPYEVALPAAMLLALGELAVAIALLFRPDSPLTQAGVVLLAALFAAAGLVAKRREEPIRCHCFGAGGNGNLGMHQLIAFVPWVAGAAILRVTLQQRPSLDAGAAWFAAVSLTIAGVRASAVWRARAAARGDRRSAQEMISWLPSH